MAESHLLLTPPTTIPPPRLRTLCELPLSPCPSWSQWSQPSHPRPLACPFYHFSLSTIPPSPIGASHLLFPPSEHTVLVHLSVNPTCHYPSLRIPFSPHSKLDPPYLHIPPSLPQSLLWPVSTVVSPRPPRMRTEYPR